MKPDFYCKLILYLWILMGNSFFAYSQEEVNGVDARALALGDMKALSRYFSNPAYLTFMKQKEFGASVYNRFKMKELNTMTIYSAIPNQTIDAGFMFSTYGYKDYRLIRGHVGLAKKLSSRLSIGTNLSYVNENSILEQESKSYLSADIGFYFIINESFEAAFATENILHTNNPFHTLCHIGILYRLLPDCRILFEVGSDFSKHFDLKAGIEYEIAGQFMVRAGFKTQDKTPSIGFAYTGIQWKTEVAFLLHPVLGVSSAIGMSYFF